MPLPFLSGGVRAEIHGSWAGQQTVNTLYFQKPAGDPTLPEVQALADLLDSWYGSAVLPNLGEAFIYLRTKVQAINVGFGFQAFDGGSTGVGGISGETAPNNVDPAITFSTGVAGRSFHGRNYIPGIPNSMVSGNILDPTWMAGLVSAYNEIAPGGANDPTPFVWVVASFFSGTDVNGDPIPRGSAIATPVFTATFSDNIVDSQRRRLPGRGK